MKAFRAHHFDLSACRRELDAFKALLEGKRELSETADIRPFFEQNQQAAAFIGSYNPRIVNFDLAADQLSLYSGLLIVGRAGN